MTARQFCSARLGKRQTRAGGTVLQGNAKPETGDAEGLAHKRLTEFVDTSDFPHVHEDHSLHSALDRMGANQLGLFLVVSRANVHQLEGVVTLQDVLALYGVSAKESLQTGELSR